MTKDTIFDIGLKAETIFGTGIIVFGSDYFFFGLLIQNKNDFPTERQEQILNRKGGSRDPDNIIVSKKWTEGKLQYTPVNGWMYYFLLTNTANPPTESPAGTFTFGSGAQIDEGDTEPFTVRWESLGSSRVSGAYSEEAHTGNRMEAITFTVDHRQSGAFGVEAISWRGVRIDPNYVDFTNGQSPVMPDGVALSTGSHPGYSHEITGGLITWDGGATFWNNMRMFTVHVTVGQLAKFIQGQLFPQFVSTGERIMVFQMEVLRDIDTTLFDDYNAQTGVATAKTLIYKIFNTSTNFRQYTLNNVVLIVSLNIPLPEEEAVYTITGMTTDFEFKVIDGVTSARYGI